MAWFVFGGLFLLFFLVFVFSLCKVSGEYAAAEEKEPQKPFVRFPVPLEDYLQQYIVHLCREKEIDPSVVFAVIATESHFKEDAVGDHGNSFGLMQIWQSWHRDRMARLGVYNLMNPYQNVLVGIDFLAELIDRGNGVDWALSYYSGNGGEECEYAYKVLRLAECIMEGAMTVG